MKPLKKDEQGNPIEDILEEEEEVNKEINEEKNEDVGEETNPVMSMDNKEKLLQESVNNLANSIKLETIKKQLNQTIDNI
jgi:hypothetical protein